MRSIEELETEIKKRDKVIKEAKRYVENVSAYLLDRYFSGWDKPFHEYVITEARDDLLSILNEIEIGSEDK